MFGVNARGIMAASQINGRLVGRVPLPRLLAVGLAMTALGGIAVLATVLGHVGLIGVTPALCVVVSSQGIVLPNATSLALSGHPRTAGSASALLGVLQYVIGAAAAPLVGVGGTATAPPDGRCDRRPGKRGSAVSNTNMIAPIALLCYPAAKGVAWKVYKVNRATMRLPDKVTR